MYKGKQYGNFFLRTTHNQNDFKCYKMVAQKKSEIRISQYKIEHVYTGLLEFYAAADI